MYSRQCTKRPLPPPAVGRSPVPPRGACRRGYWRGVGVAGATEATGRVCEETELRASVYRATVTRLAVARAAADDRRCGVDWVLYTFNYFSAWRGSAHKRPQNIGVGSARSAGKKYCCQRAAGAEKNIAYWPDELRRCAGGNRAELARSPWAHYVRRA